MPANIEQEIHIKGARVHNLKNVDFERDLQPMADF